MPMTNNSITNYTVNFQLKIIFENFLIIFERFSCCISTQHFPFWVIFEFRNYRLGIRDLKYFSDNLD